MGTTSLWELNRWLLRASWLWIWLEQLQCFRDWWWCDPRWSEYCRNYSKSVLSFSWVSFVDVSYSFSKVVLSSSAIVDALESEDGLASFLVLSWSEWNMAYLLKLRNLALTQSLTCLPAVALAIFLVLGAAAIGSDIWLFN